MPYSILCRECGHQLPVSENVFTERIAGKKVSIRCKQCLKLIVVDGSDPAELAALVVGPGAENRPKAEVQPTLVSPTEQPARAASPRTAPAPRLAAVAPTLASAGVPSTKPNPPPPPSVRKPSSPGRPPAAPLRPLGKTLLGLPPRPMDASPGVPPPPPRHAPAAVEREKPIPPVTAPPKLEAIASPPKLQEIVQPPSMADVTDDLPSTVRTTPEPPVAVQTEVDPRHEGIREAEATPAGVAIDDPVQPPASPVPVVRDGASSSPSRLRKRVALLAAAAVVLGAGAALLPLKLRGEPSPDAKSVAPALKVNARATPAPVAPAAPAAPRQEAEVKSPPEPSDAPVEEKKAEASAKPAAAAPAVKDAVEHDLPAYVSPPVVLHLTGVALRRAQRCHPKGHAVGTSDVFITFGPRGHVTEAHLEGEPVASAPVAKCILDHARSVIIPKFKGEPFTLRQQITMR